MPKVFVNPAVGEMSGTIGNLTYSRYKPGQVIVRKRGERKAPKQPGEIANQDEFRRAVRYAKTVWGEQPALKARYITAARLQGRQGFNLAKADYRRPPTVEEIDISQYIGHVGDLIAVTALDDFDVHSVRLTIRSLSGPVVEQGDALNINGRWIYRAQSEVPAGQTVVIEATATDYPNHSTMRQIDHACGPRTNGAT